MDEARDGGMGHARPGTEDIAAWARHVDASALADAEAGETWAARFGWRAGLRPLAGLEQAPDPDASGNEAGVDSGRTRG